MKAMILAAGRGLRMGPLTERVPKALLEVRGAPILEHVARRLRRAGVTELIINLHHKAELIEAFLASKGSFGLRIELSREEELLETGGGLKKAAWFFDDGEPFFLHNADVVSGVDLGALSRSHRETGALATLSVRERPTTRPLLFDRDGRLRGRAVPGAGTSAPSAEGFVPLGFDGIQVISPGLLSRMTETGAFSIMETYLRLASEGQAVLGRRSDAEYWADIGSKEKLEKARADAERLGL